MPQTRLQMLQNLKRHKIMHEVAVVEAVAVRH